MIKKIIEFYRTQASRTWVVLCIVMLFSFVLLFAIRQHVRHPFSGDEPHYLTMVYSLVNDADLDLKNNWDNQDYFRYYPDLIEPHVSPLNTENPASGWYSFHGIGLALLLLPFFVLNEAWGPKIFMLLAATVVLYLVYLWCAAVTKNKRMSIAGPLVLAACYFFNGLSGYIYPDLIIAGILLGALIVIQQRHTTSVGQVVFALLLISLVFVHAKAALLAAPLFVAYTYTYRSTTKKWPIILLVLSTVFAVIFTILQYRWFGVLNPGAIYPSNVGLSVSPLKSFPAILFDVKRGLLVYNPALWLLVPGIFLWVKYRRDSFILTVAVVLPAVILTMGFSEWYGGYAPTGRYMMNYIPALMPAIILVLIRARRMYEMVPVYVVLLLTALISLFATFIKLSYPSSEVRSIFFTELQNYMIVPFDKLLPAYNLQTEVVGRFGIFKVLLWVAILAVFLFCCYILSYRKDSKHR